MRSRSSTRVDTAELEHGCVDWFDYERYRKERRGRYDRPRRGEFRIQIPQVTKKSKLPMRLNRS